MVYDVAIVGGGLGGLTLSIQLRKLGYSVILFEKEVFPFNKMCGEYISMESYDYLQRLGLNLDALNLPKITQLQISSPSGKTIHSSLDLGGFGIRRYTLDFLLSKIAIANGVSLQQGERVLAMDEVDAMAVSEQKKKRLKIENEILANEETMAINLKYREQGLGEAIDAVDNQNAELIAKNKALQNELTAIDKEGNAEREKILADYQQQLETARNDYWATIGQIETQIRAQRSDIIKKIYEDPDAAAQLLSDKYGLIYIP
jgi:monoamine oxidase